MKNEGAAWLGELPTCTQSQDLNLDPFASKSFVFSTAPYKYDLICDIGPPTEWDVESLGYQEEHDHWDFSTH